jgi:hypothetical protein
MVLGLLLLLPDRHRRRQLPALPLKLQRLLPLNRQPRCSCRRVAEMVLGLLLLLDRHRRRQLPALPLKLQRLLPLNRRPR